jgi:hypothetical protein
MYFDGEHILTTTTQVTRAQPFKTTLTSANVLVCIVLLVQILFPGKCGCVWGDFQLIDLGVWLSLFYFGFFKLDLLYRFLKYWMGENIFPR